MELDRVRQFKTEDGFVYGQVRPVLGAKRGEDCWGAVYQGRSGKHFYATSWSADAAWMQVCQHAMAEGDNR